MRKFILCLIGLYIFFMVNTVIAEDEQNKNIKSNSTHTTNYFPDNHYNVAFLGFNNPISDRKN